jgi:hypothetical protein
MLSADGLPRQLVADEQRLQHAAGTVAVAEQAFFNMIPKSVRSTGLIRAMSWMR